MNLKTLQKTAPWDWPPDIDKRLLGVLADRGAPGADRLIAAELAGDLTVMNDELARALLAIAGNGEEPEELRGQAAIALGPALEEADIEGFDEPEESPISEATFLEIRNVFHSLFQDAGLPVLIRRRVLEASVRASEDWHREAIRAAYSSADEEWKLTAVFCMAEVGGFDSEILESLESGNPDIRREALIAAGAWSLDAAWGHVESILTSENPDKESLLSAIEAAASIRPSEAFELLDQLTTSADEEVAEGAQEALAMAEGLLDDRDAEDDDGEEDEDEADGGADEEPDDGDDSHTPR